MRQPDFDHPGRQQQPVATVTSRLTLAAGQDLTVTQTVAVMPTPICGRRRRPIFTIWQTTVSNQNAVADIYNTPLGCGRFRLIRPTACSSTGSMYGSKGMCNHQDMAGVGSALPDRLQYYRIERLKEMGCNGYRTSHNEPTAELLNACDQLGMLVLDENRRIGTNAEPIKRVEPSNPPRPESSFGIHVVARQ
jgi:beta-galactosidase